MATYPLYSQLLWEVADVRFDGTLVQSSPVPNGYVWVVREAVLTNRPPSGAGKGIPSLTLSADSTVPIFSTPFNGTVAGKLYTLHDCRHVLSAGSTLAVSTGTEYWYLRVSGYQLTA